MKEQNSERNKKWNKFCEGCKNRDKDRAWCSYAQGYMHYYPNVMCQKFESKGLITKQEVSFELSEEDLIEISNKELDVYLALTEEEKKLYGSSKSCRSVAKITAELLEKREEGKHLKSLTENKVGNRIKEETLCETHSELGEILLSINSKNYTLSDANRDITEHMGKCFEAGQKSILLSKENTFELGKRAERERILKILLEHSHIIPSEMEMINKELEGDKDE